MSGVSGDAGVLIGDVIGGGGGRKCKEVVENGALTPKFCLTEASKKFIALTPSEEQLFEIIRRACKGFGTTLRIAGGWVRDKLKQVECGDIDIAVDNLSGEQVAAVIMDYLNVNYPYYSKKDAVVSQANPDNSKHLQTAIMKIQNVEFNFVQLRSDFYSDHSRIPRVICGTPFDDALRRDLTINSLFYNINDDIIEDFTGNGLSDLKRKVINTPLEPFVTLVDDPLRALRIIRFAVRLGFRIDEGLWKAIKSSTLHEMLRKKVSVPRIGTEVQIMLSEPLLRPVRALQLLVESGLHQVVFESRGTAGELGNDWSDVEFSERLKKCLIAACMLSRLCIESKEKVVILCGLFLMPETFCSERDIFCRKIIDTIFSMKLGIKNQEIRRILASLDQAHRISLLINRMAMLVKGKDVKSGDLILAYEEALEDPEVRLELGYWLRNNRVNWRSLVILSSIWNGNLICYSEKILEGDEFSSFIPEGSLMREMAFISAIEAHGLDYICEMKLDFSGEELRSMFSLSSGPVIGELLKELLRWRILNGEATREQARRHMKIFYQSLRK